MEVMEEVMKEVMDEVMEEVMEEVTDMDMDMDMVIHIMDMDMDIHIMGIIMANKRELKFYSFMPNKSRRLFFVFTTNGLIN